MKIRVIIILVFVILVVAAFSFYMSGNIGISIDKINQEQMKTVSWDVHDYGVIGSSDDESIYVGVMYMKDYSDARYFIYIKRGGLSYGWHFLQSGNLTEIEGIKAFDCGEYGTAYVSLNNNGNIKKIEFSDGREPSVNENVGNIVCEQSQSPIIFYDINGTIIDSDKQIVVR